ncbi:peptide chain release factor-like protein [Actinomadura rudentiformis]|uniref:PCRF domain-containing protein n=1 Tax=Actinomadura rudentiformis TaxID=359158 RepID=A0A6H9YRW5_9ACTN|nr:peptide chain release factor-like protein [Actinomadura rudentiformis]KAB2343725.1 PCRF domain-containing protein [Actinomadura rudentiformis]
MCFVEIRPGEGGADALAFAAELADTIAAWAARRGWPVDRAATDPGRTIVMTMAGVPVTQLAWLSGTHRLQHQPRNDRRGRRHTSTATVAVMPQPARPAAPLIQEEDLRVQTMRGRGRGGQRKNKVETAVRLHHLPTGIVITRTSGRSQAANLASARADLEHRLRLNAERQSQRITDHLRRTQVHSERSAKTFTHNTQRSQVTDHTTGQRWSLRAWRQGRLDPDQ